MVLTREKNINQSLPIRIRTNEEAGNASGARLRIRRRRRREEVLAEVVPPVAWSLGQVVRPQRLWRFACGRCRWQLGARPPNLSPAPRDAALSQQSGVASRLSVNGPRVNQSLKFLAFYDHGVYVWLAVPGLPAQLVGVCGSHLSIISGGAPGRRCGRSAAAP